MTIENLQFPIHSPDDYQGRVVFKVFEEDPPDLGNIGTELLSTITGATEALKGAVTNAFEEAFTPEQQQSYEELSTPENIIAAKGQTVERQTKIGPPQPRVVSQCSLYLPAALSIADGAEYENIDLGVIGATIEASVAAGIGVGAATVEGVKTSVESWIAAFRNNADINSDIGKLAVVRTANKILNNGGAGAVQSATRVAVNPNTRAIFKQVPLREFSFTFKLIAASRKEAQEIKRIVKLFRTELYPEEFTVDVGEVQVPLGYNIPNKIGIEFQYRDKPIATKIKPCFLRSMTTTYNKSGMGFHDDGEFTEVEVQMTFIESRTLKRSDIEEGF